MERGNGGTGDRGKGGREGREGREDRGEEMREGRQEKELCHHKEPNKKPNALLRYTGVLGASP